MRRQGRYRTTKLGVADDFVEADGKNVLTFYQAKAKAESLVAENDEEPKAEVTVADAVAAYVASARAAGKATADEMERRAERLILPHLGHRRVADLNTGDLNRWRDALALSPALYRGGKKRRPSTDRQRRATTNKLVTILKSALNHALREGAVENGGAWSRERFKPFPEADEAKVRFLTEDEAARFINAAEKDNGFRDLARAALETGARYGELARLRVRDFAIVENGEPVGILTINVSKSGKGRSIDLTPEGMDFFRRLTVGRSPGDVLLPRRQKIDDEIVEREWRKSEQNRPTRAACKAAKIDPPIGFHILRHTWASLAVMSGMPRPKCGRARRTFGHRT